MFLNEVVNLQVPQEALVILVWVYVSGGKYVYSLCTVVYKGLMDIDCPGKAI